MHVTVGTIRPQNAIRKKTEALNYLRLGSRLDAVVSRLDTQVCCAEYYSKASSSVNRFASKSSSGTILLVCADAMLGPCTSLQPLTVRCHQFA